MPSDSSWALAVALMNIIAPLPTNASQTLVANHTANIQALAVALDNWRADHRWPAVGIK